MTCEKPIQKEGRLKDESTGVAFRSTLTCPQCGHQETEIMPTDACQYFYDCKECGAVLRPKPGDCCVFCSYGDVKCPSKQSETDCGC